MASDLPFPAPQPRRSGFADDEGPDFRTLFHQLNNQLGIILANAELLEARLGDADNVARAGHIVSSAVEAIALARRIRGRAATR